MDISYRRVFLYCWRHFWSESWLAKIYICQNNFNSQETGFSVWKYLTIQNLYNLFVSEIGPNLKYCSHVWRTAPPSFLIVFRAITRINDGIFISKIQPLAHCRACGNLSLLYHNVGRVPRQCYVIVVPCIIIISYCSGH